MIVSQIAGLVVGIISGIAVGHLGTGAGYGKLACFGWWLVSVVPVVLVTAATLAVPR